MKQKSVIIIGAGLAGVSGFYELVARGVPTVLIDAADDVAQGASFANGAVLHPSLPDPWNNPGIALPLMRSLFDRKAAMKLHLSQVPDLMGWGWSFLRHASPARHRAITKANYALADYSTWQTLALKQKLNLQFEDARPGTLKLLRNEAERAAALALADMLAESGLRYSLLDRDALLAREPALAASENLTGALHFPDDMLGNARLFCVALAKQAVAMGGKLRLGTKVENLLVRDGRVCGVRLADEEIRGEVVLAAGVGATALARSVGLRLPVRPAKGYSLTLNTQNLSDDASHLIPTHPLVDPQLHIAITPLPKRVRILGMAEFAGFNRQIEPHRMALLRGFFEQLMPNLARQLDWEKADAWAGLRPMSADGRPFIGASSVDGLWLNVGHGHLGWTMATGSAKILADKMTGATPEIDASAFAANR